MHVPPASSSLLLASLENERAHTVIFGTSNKRSSSRTLQTTTVTLSYPYFFNLFAKNDNETGYLLTLEWFNLLSTALLNLLSVLLAKKV